MEPGELDQLARLHVACLPDSLVSELGEDYATRFYRFVAGSPKEIVLAHQADDGTVVAGCVTSLEPLTLNRRLLLGTPLAWFALLRLGRVAAVLLRGLRRDPAVMAGTVPRLTLPELIIIFTAAATRGQGVGAKLIERVERQLIERGVRLYQVKTVADAQNRALAFYARCGFTPAGVIAEGGRRFQVFTKAIGTA